MRNLIKKILRESIESDDITIAGVTFTIDDFISKGYDNKNDIFLKVKPTPNGRIDYEKFLEIQSILKNAGIDSEPQTYNSDGNVITNVYGIRIRSLNLKGVLKIYLETMLNTNSDTFFE